MENQLRKTISDNLLNATEKHFVLELSTGVGKSKLALDKISQLYSPDAKILIVIPRNVLIQNWIDEFKKWHYEDMLNNVTFVTYVSLPKMAGYWDICCFDECHHLSERCREALTSFHIEHALFLSATISKDVRYFINYQYNKYEELKWIRVGTKKAIENNVLPDPEIILYPILLDNTKANLLYSPKKIKEGKSFITVPYKERWLYKKSKKPYKIQCTQLQYYNELSGIIDWYKRKAFQPIMKNMWLHKAGERLKWLAEQKLSVVKDIIKALKNRRAIVFCGSIDQSKHLGVPCVNSEVGINSLTKFNEGKVDIISCVGMLDEGANLNNCQVGIFDMLNSSEKLQVQRIGRILRHKHPVIVIPYFKNTRDEEILKKMLEGYNSNHIFVIDSIIGIINKIKNL